MSKNKEHKDCLRCDMIPCIDLFAKRGELQGGEIYVMQDIIKNKHHVPCELGALIYALCQLLKEIPSASSFGLFFQCIRDLRAIAFLILSAHYRSAMQLLRPVIENWLTGIYWDIKFSLAEPADQAITEQDYVNFQHGKYEIPEIEWQRVLPDIEGDGRRRHLNHRFLLAWTVSKNIISLELADRIGKQIWLLNKFLHPHVRFTEVARSDCPPCAASVAYNAAQYKECTKHFQNVVTYLLETFYEYIRLSCPEKIQDENIQFALGWLISLPTLQKDIKQKLIFSDELEQFILSLGVAEDNH